MRVALVIVMMATRAAADTGSAAPVVEPAPAALEQPKHRCAHPIYAEGSLLLGDSRGPDNSYNSPGPIILRFAFGYRHAFCRGEQTLPVVHLGAAFETALKGTDDGFAYAAMGVELQVTWPLTPSLQLGPRVSALQTSHSYQAFTVGARLEHRRASLGIDVLVIPPRDNDPVPRQATGVYAVASAHDLPAVIITSVAMLALVFVAAS
jgi:hypothetical protein